MHDLEETQKEGGTRHERTRTGEDVDNKFGDRRSGQFGGLNGRFGNRHDQEHERPRRRQDDEDGETRNRRDHDRPRWGKDEKVSEEVDENGNVKSGFRRDPQVRSRFEQSWLRSDRGTEEARKDNDRPGWRRDRPKDGEWDMPVKTDVDPEWMDAVDTAEPAQAHTQEDFQRWKERMKAAANGQAEDKLESTAAAKPGANEGSKPPPADSARIMSPDLAANSMDKFFAKFTEKRATSEEKVVTKPAAKSKFASLFSPPADVKPEVVASVFAPTSPVAASITTSKSPVPVFDPVNAVDADQAGFKRILEMLGKRDLTPTFEAPRAKHTALGGDQQPQERHQSPDLVALFKQGQPSRQTPVSRPPPGFEGLAQSRSPAEGHRQQDTPNKDELLLHLLRQAEISAKPSQEPQREFSEQRRQPPAAVFPNIPELGRNEPRQLHEDRSEIDRQAVMAQQQQRSGNRSMFDDPAISNMSYQDDLGARQGLSRRPTNGYEDLYLDRLRQHEQQKPMQPPPGMPRPPGLEQISRMPPGWPGQPPSQHQQPRPGPPPGISMPRGMQPPFGAPQQQPSMAPMPPQGQRAPQRKYTNESGVPSFPPGIGPPPGFMPNGPPPGFHHNGPAGSAPGYGRFGMGETQGSQQGPPSMGRAFMEMYNQPERGGLRGGNGGVPLPPGFR